MREFRKFKCLEATRNDLPNLIPYVIPYLTKEDEIDFGAIFSLPEVEHSITYAFTIMLEDETIDVAFDNKVRFFGVAYEPCTYEYYNEIPEKKFEVEYLRKDKEFDYSSYSRKGGVHDLLDLAFIVGSIINYYLDKTDYLNKLELDVPLYKNLGWNKVCSFKLKLKDESQPLTIRAETNLKKYIVLSDNVDFLDKNNQYEYLNIRP